MFSKRKVKSKEHTKVVAAEVQGILEEKTKQPIFSNLIATFYGAR